MKNKEIVMEIIKNNSTNNQTEITNKEIIDIAQIKYNKKLYNKTLNEALIQLETLGYIIRCTTKNDSIILNRTIYITNNNIANIKQKNKILEIINSIEKGDCLTIDEITKKFCENILTENNVEFISKLMSVPEEKIIKKIYNQNKKTIQTILQELTENNKIIEHRAVKKLGRNVPKKIKDKVQNLPTNTKYYTPRRLKGC